MTAPEKCPVCGEPLTHIDDEVILRCENMHCPAQVQCLFEHFVSREAMNIENLGPALIASLIATGKIKRIPDLYRLTLEDLESQERMAKKSAKNVYDAIAASKERSLENLLHGLGIRFVGRTSARNLAKHFRTLEAIRTATVEDLQNVNDVGERIRIRLLPHRALHARNRRTHRPRLPHRIQGRREDAIPGANRRHHRNAPEHGPRRSPQTHRRKRRQGQRFRQQEDQLGPRGRSRRKQTHQGKRTRNPRTRRSVAFGANRRGRFRRCNRKRQRILRGHAHQQQAEPHQRQTESRRRRHPD